MILLTEKQLQEFIEKINKLIDNSSGHNQLKIFQSNFVYPEFEIKIAKKVVKFNMKLKLFNLINDVD